VTSSASAPDGPLVQPPRLVALTRLVMAQALVMLVYAALTLVLALTGDPNWGAVAFVLVNLVLWGSGLLFVARRGLPQHKRWAFSPVMFTQLVFGVIAVEDLRSAGNPPVAVVAWLVVLVSAVTALIMLFSAPVRTTLVPPPSPGP
jgi:hypothetical protein